MITQLNPAIPVICPKGKGLAHFVIDYGIESHLYWTVFLDNSGECWTFANPDIRAQKNITAGREHISPFYDPKDVALLKKESDSRTIHMRCYKCLISDMIFFKDLEQWECPHCCNKFDSNMHVLYLRCYKCNLLDYVFSKDGKEWKCLGCNIINNL